MLKFNNPKFTTKDKIEILQRYLLINSYLYYEIGTSVVSDERYDEESGQLYQFKKDCPQEYSKARYSYAMRDFDGNTGFGFIERLNETDRKSIVLHAECMVRF